jgi:hypothetical protein
LILCDESGGVNDRVDVKGRSFHSKQTRPGQEKAVFVPERGFKTVLQEGV